MVMKKYLLASSGVVILVAVLLAVALFNNLLPNDKDGYHYGIVDGKITKIKIFTPPAGTQLMSETVNGDVVHYYGTTTEQKP